MIPIGNVARLQTGPKKAGEENSKENSKENNKENSKENNKENSKENSSLKMESKIIDILQVEPELSIEKIAKRLNVTNGTVRYYVEILKRTGILEHVGPTKKGKWVIHHGN